MSDSSYSWCRNWLTRGRSKRPCHLQHVQTFTDAAWRLARPRQAGIALGTRAMPFSPPNPAAPSAYRVSRAIDADMSSTVTVYRWEKWDNGSRRFVLEPQYATSEAIARSGGVVLQRTGLVVDAARVDENGFVPTRLPDSPLAT